MRGKRRLPVFLFILTLSLGLIVLLKPFSSRRPDGLQKVAYNMGLAKDFDENRKVSNQTGQKKEIYLGIAGVLLLALPSAFWIVRKELSKQSQKK